MDMNVKNLPCSVKAAGPDDGLAEGEYRAIVSAYSPDSVGDKVVPGAFKDTLQAWEDSGNKVPLIWSHDWNDPFSHIGEVVEAKETDAGLEVRARLDLDDNPKAKQAYKLLHGRRVNNHSFAYNVVDSAPNEKDSAITELRKLDLIECGPCLVGANQDTPVLDVKSALPASSGPNSTSDAAWDGPANEARLSTDAGASTYRKAYAWVDPDGDPDKKASYRFVHHEVSQDGTVGAANIKACVTGIGVLNGGRGGTQIPDGDRQGVYNHLAKHIKDAGDEVPELRDGDSGSDEKASDDDGGQGGKVTVSRATVNALKSALQRLTDETSGSDSDSGSGGSDSDSSKDATPETGQPTVAVANTPARVSDVSAEQPQHDRSAQVKAGLVLTSIDTRRS